MDVLLSATVGFLSAAALASLTQWMTQWYAARQEKIRWQHEQEKDARAAKRADIERTYDHRRAAYVAYLTEWYRLLFYIGGYYDHLHQDDMDGALVPLMSLEQEVYVYGTPEIGAATEAATRALGPYLSRPDEQDSAMEAFTALRELIQHDLRSPA